MQRVLLQAQPAGLQSNQRGLQLYLPQRPLQWLAPWVSCLRYSQRPRLQRKLLIFAAELSYVQQHLLPALPLLQLQPVRLLSR